MKTRLLSSSSLQKPSSSINALLRRRKVALPQPLRLALFAIWLIAPALLPAQDFTLDSFFLAGGGGSSSGGDFELTATVGEPAAGAMQGADFDLSGGFWSIIPAVPSSGSPRLNLSVAGDLVSLAWPETAGAGFVLEESTSLAAPPGNAPWTRVDVAPQASDGQQIVQLPLANGSRFYRLHAP